jgi:uncharacterized protein (TIGR02246 family)
MSTGTRFKRTMLGTSLAVLLIATASAAFAGGMEEVTAAMNAWRDNLKASSATDTSKITSLYAKDAVLWGTISPTIRATPALINDYFVNAYKKLPKLTVVFKDPHIRVFGDVALNSGYYTFNYEKEGKMVDLPARYSFAYVKRDGKWQIVDHHSSGMPK